MRRLPSIVLVGRPNVGKSTLFNRLTETRRAIVTSIPGTTRDVIAQPVEWQGVHFELTDTGGMFGASQDPLHALVLDRGRRAIEAADLLVLVVDGREGRRAGRSGDRARVRAAGKPALLAVNKTDDRRGRAGAGRVPSARVRAGARDFRRARRGHWRSARIRDHLASRRAGHRG